MKLKIGQQVLWNCHNNRALRWPCVVEELLGTRVKLVGSSMMGSIIHRTVLKKEILPVKRNHYSQETIEKFFAKKERDPLDVQYFTKELTHLLKTLKDRTLEDLSRYLRTLANIASPTEQPTQEDCTNIKDGLATALDVEAGRLDGVHQSNAACLMRQASEVIRSLLGRICLNSNLDRLNEVTVLQQELRETQQALEILKGLVNRIDQCPNTGSYTKTLNRDIMSKIASLTTEKKPRC